MTEFKILNKNRFDHVLKACKRGTDSNYNAANFEGTGLALCGILKKGETIEQFYLRYKRIV